MENSVCAIELKGITKRFGEVVANDGIDLQLNRGEILSLLGENGSGKTTLMNMLSGIYFPDEGQIFVNGEPVSIRSPKDAFAHGIGMIHQHYKLVDVFTAAENIVLGLEEKGRLDMKAAEEKVRAICEKYGFDINPGQKIYDMSVSQKQTVEIVKVLYRGAGILILDEPTAVLTPQETDKLFDVLRAMKADGKAIVIITHKLHEVMALSDKVAVLRKGKYIGTVRTSQTNPQALTDMMVGHAVTLNIDRPRYEKPVERLEVRDLTVLDGEGVKKLDGVSFTAMGGEILGVAGIAGSGQKELLEAISGLCLVSKGEILYTPDGQAPASLVGKTPMQIRKAGVAMAFVPEDRLGMGLVGSMGMTGNMMLRSWKKGRGVFLNRKDPNELALRVWKDLEVVTPSTDFPVRRMSGGNVQKVLVGREIASAPSVLMTAYAVRGLDINTSYTIYSLLTEQKMKGVAVIYVGEDLDVLLELCDRILVLCGGKVSGVVDARSATKEQIGLLMTRLGGKEGA
ncbi:ABC transporter ATP-binding protein [uncultured Oscillibacter sp.]|uniref:ABC transporter ATP-binding protein n=1 Tax=uncultured Oscillibacter sp. TaxID=876091 RepID=UPI0021721C89|nr:ABC transporter ATP-binding protein [uncultured Oscillibacter sp.]MCI9553842.1 ABC transporter ATP-binding protein [Oscillibacter sp.]